MSESCVFCNIVSGSERPINGFAGRWPDAIAIVPLGPVVDGHVIVIPNAHIRDALEDPVVSAAAMARACEIAEAPCNIITSVGTQSTQTVMHLHIHVVPRSADDGLKLPWSAP